MTYEEIYILNSTSVVKTEYLIEVISSVLNAILQETDKYNSNSIEVFNGKSVPQISVKNYLYRIYKCSHCSQECFILALIYIDRIT